MKTRDYVELLARRNRGWPWPENLGFMSSVYGEDGWCRACGTPLGPQIGPLVLQNRGITVKGAWMPYWWHDAICVEKSLALEAAARFGLEMVEVGWHGKPPGEAMQLVIPVAGERWFDPAALEAATLARHGSTGARCGACGTWRWMPVALNPQPRFGAPAPPLRVEPEDSLTGPVVASPEWFGDGWNSLHEFLVRRELAEFMVGRCPREFEINEVRWG